MPVDETTWAEIRRAYEAEPEPVTVIARRFPVSVSSIYRRAKQEGWQRPQSVVAKAPAIRQGRVGDDGPVKDRRQKTSVSRALRRVSERDVIARLYRAIDDKLKQWEARMGSGKELSAAESERETRELGVMIRSFEKVTEFATEIENRRKTAAPEPISAADAERMRAEIAERLERLNAQGDAGPRSGEAE
jgi:hypothetical protein